MNFKSFAGDNGLEINNARTEIHNEGGKKGPDKQKSGNNIKFPGDKRRSIKRGKRKCIVCAATIEVPFVIIARASRRITDSAGDP